MALTPQWLDELRARISLSGVIGRTTRLTRAGHEWKACCPFHNEKSPSFTVNDDKGFYHCFGCGAHGDVIRWLCDQRGLAFIDAVRELAGEAGLEMPAPDPRAAAKAEQQAGLHEAMAAAQAWFVGNLAGEAGSAARAYLATRGFDAHTVERFGFGFAPSGRQGLREALAVFPEAMLIEGGLRIAVDDDSGGKREPYDRFRDRLMLPICDPRGRVIAFGGRILDNARSDAPKYLNSPDTPLFDKGRTLYNLHRAGPLARQSGRLVVVEGYMDVVALAAAGIGEVVAPMGTALTERQIELAWRLVETPILCFDGDAAGRRAAIRAVTRALPLLRPAHSLRIARLPAAMDPDDLVRRQGVAAMEALLTGAASLIETLWLHERDALPLDTPEAKAGLKARLLTHVETIADKDIGALYRREMLDRFSAHAFPPKVHAPLRRWEPHSPSQRPERTPLPSTASQARMRRATGGGARAGLISAVVIALMERPGEIARHTDLLTGLAAEEPRIGIMLDHHDRAGRLETETLHAILQSAGFDPQDRTALHNKPYTFLSDGDEAAASVGLAAAIAKLVEDPLLDAAMEDALARFDQPELQRLRLRKAEINGTLAQYAAAARA